MTAEPKLVTIRGALDPSEADYRRYTAVHAVAATATGDCVLYECALM